MADQSLGGRLRGVMAVAAERVAVRRKSEPQPPESEAERTPPAARSIPTVKAAPKTAAKKSASKAPAKKAAPRKAAPKKAATRKATATQAPVQIVAPTEQKAPDMEPAESGLPYREGETPWTAAEIAGVRTELLEELDGLNSELAGMEADLHHLMSEGVDTAGDDQADAGTKTYEREHEMSLAASVRVMRDQVARALRLFDLGEYGTCTSCGLPIGKLRLQAFPRATMCLACKQKQERR